MEAVIDYSICGKIDSEDTIVFLHGFKGDLNSLKVFENSFLNFKQIYISLHTIEKDTSLSLKDYADGVFQVLNKENVSKCIFVCHSFGGRVVFKMLEFNDYIVSKLVLIDVAGIKPKFSIKKKFKILQYKLYKKLKIKIKENRFGSTDYKSLSEVHKKTFINILKENFNNKVSKIKIPTLIIFGKQDRDTPIYMAHYLHKKIKSSFLEIIKNAGHFSYLTHKNDVVSLAQFFVCC